MELANWKDLDKKELNSIKGIFLADRKNENALHNLAIDYCNDIDSHFQESNDFVYSLMDRFLDYHRVSEKQAFWLAVAYLTSEKAKA